MAIVDSFKKIYISKTVVCEDCLKTVSIFSKVYVCTVCGAFVICKRCHSERHPCAVCSTINDRQIVERFKGRKVKSIATLMQMGFNAITATNSLIRSSWNMDAAVQNALTTQSNEEEKRKREAKLVVMKKKVKSPNLKPSYITLQPLSFNTPDDLDSQSDSENVISYETPNKPKYEILTKEDIYNLFLDEINTFSEVNEVELDQSSIAVLSGGTNKPKKNGPSFELFMKDGTCDICYEEGRLVGERCGHMFCVKCWNDNLKTNATFSYDSFHCMQAGCVQPLSLQFVLSYCSKEVITLYKKMVVHNFLAQHRSYQRCCGNECERVIHVIHSGKPNIKVSCYCGHEFCFGCGRERHEPATCAEVEKWEGQYQEEAESQRAINAISKPCFHCGLMTERTKGCNHMTCPKCHGEWCWMCRGDWKNHGPKTGGFYRCTLYEKSEAKKLDEEAEKTKSDAERYEYYYEHFLNNKIEIGRFEEVVQHKKMLFEKTKNLAQVEVLGMICSSVENCLKALQYSYVKMFFLPRDDVASDLFLYRQEVLENSVIQLEKSVKEMTTTGQLPMLLEEAMNSKTIMNNLCQ
ncbi:protein ariadne-1, putative [Entamoeba invadens IP1]|uniref:RBR-type E3 ubiquitin transferase n=1 Tax=Entamoeba invadens IP1 TaxID=370355 RepID=A0A0A1TXT1_ENTIV|nr:protein ariadne-1, putative [Entamoeba invadens IP1]ELP86185.1 protein ariadne-1, putative [Entamoeba invadens IP1]|eukprot:XP_004185531.1 protein ariadne-1, putative [Entamoeba invadens IP1]